MSLEMVPFTASDAYNVISFTDLSSAVGKHFRVLQGFMDDVHGGIPTYIVQKDGNLKTSFWKLKLKLDSYHIIPLLRDAEDKSQCVLRIFGVRKPAVKKRQNRRKIPLQPILLVATIASVLVAGFFISQQWFSVLKWGTSAPLLLLTMIEYAASLMVILTVHELGHIIACKLHLIESTLPYFIPAPPLLGPGLYTPGTFGALIIQKGSPVNRDELFDLGIAGPFLGFIVALVVTFMGVALSVSVESGDGGVFSLPPPLIFIIASLFPVGMFPPGSAIVLHPVAQAGYLGLIITCLNLFPTSQLDGGHMSRAAFGPRGYERASILSLLILFLLGSIPPYTFLPFALLIFFFSLGGRHPGPLDDVSKISGRRKLMLVMGFIVLLLSLPMDYVRILQFF